jgi:chemotaxis signal transduction protein/nucleoid-associated protein YgaU
LETALRTEQQPSADRGRAPPRCWLVFRVGGCLLCASALDVEGIIPRPESFAKFPLMPDYALGAFLFRGRSAAAISLRSKLKLRQGEDSSSGPFVVAQVGDALVAFWVDEVSDVIEEKDADWRPLPELLPRGLFERLAIRGDEIILQTRFAALLEAEVVSGSIVALADARPDPPVERVVAAPAATESARQAPDFEVASTRVRIAPAVAPRRKREPEIRRRRRVERPAPRPVPRTNPAMRSPVIAPPSPAPSKSMSTAVVHGQKASLIRYLLAAVAVVVVSLAATALLLHEAPPGPAPEPRPVAVAAAPPPQITTPLPAQSTAPAPVARVHVVIPGDTLWDIAKTYAGDPLQYPALAKVSSISNPHLIRPGDVVRVETAQREQTGLAR